MDVGALVGTAVPAGRVGLIAVALSCTVSLACGAAGVAVIAAVGMRSRSHWFSAGAPMRV